MKYDYLKAFKKNSFYYICISFILFVILIVCSPDAYAQQTIINIPSSEILPAGDLLFKDSNRFGSFSSGRNVSLTPSVTFGTGFGTELSTAIGTSIDKNYSATVRNDISAKKVFFLGSSTRLTFGGTISPYLTQFSHPDTFIYTHLSKRIKKTRTSLTAGAYMNGQKGPIDTGGVILGLEQVIIPNKLRLAFDWTSGQDSLGRMGVGFKYRPIPTVSITSAVIMPNEDTDNIAFNISISKFISLDDENPIKRRLKNVD